MTNVGFSIELERNRGAGRQGAVRRLGKIELQSRDFSPAFKKIRRSFYAAERSQFETEGGGKWTPDTPATLQRKRARGQDPRVMRRTGALFTALTTGAGEGAINEMSATELALGTSLKQGVIAQRVSDRRRRRRIVIMTKRRRTKWTQYIREHIMSDEA